MNKMLAQAGQNVVGRVKKLTGAQAIDTLLNISDSKKLHRLLYITFFQTRVKFKTFCTLYGIRLVQLMMMLPNLRCISLPSDSNLPF